MTGGNKEIKRWQKPDELAHAVMTQTPGEVAEFFKSLGEVDLTVRALGLACRYRGLEMAKVLVEGGADFRYDLGKIRLLWDNSNRVAELEEGMNFAVALLGSLGSRVLNYFSIMGDQYNRKILPIEERLAVLDYLCENARRTGFDKDDLLFLAYFSNERVIAERLKEKGAKIPEMWIRIITEGVWNELSQNKWHDYCFMTQKVSDEDFMPCMSAVLSELGGRKLHYTEWLWTAGLAKRQNIPGFFKFLIDNFDLSKVNKGNLMKSMILHNSMDGLAAAVELGWLKQPKKRDEMIAFATEKGMTECAAFLLDFKNRTADLAAERVRAEKKAQRELNAAPDSATVLKQFWSFKKRGDGSVIITGYKGNKTEFTVPSRIGKSEVREIDMLAFSPLAPRLSGEIKELRRAITAVTLPGTVKKIGEQAFTLCKSLETVIIPEGVTEFGFHVFSKCPKLERVELPRSLAKVDDVMEDSGLNMFDGSPNVTAVVYPESFAEEYCRRNNIPFIYNET